MPGLVFVAVVIGLLWVIAKILSMLTAPRPPDPRSLYMLTEGERVDVVGESYCQDALERLAGSKKRDESASFDCTAVLEREPQNPVDPDAVVVKVDGRTVGYLSREEAREFAPLVDEHARRGLKVACSARITGGWDRGSRGTGKYGIWLRLREKTSHAKKANKEKTRVDVETLIAEAIDRIAAAKGPAVRRKILQELLTQLADPDQRVRVMAEASRIEVDAVLDKVETLKTAASKRRRLSEALEELKADPVPDEMQAFQMKILVGALDSLDRQDEAEEVAQLSAADGKK